MKKVKEIFERVFSNGSKPRLIIVSLISIFMVLILFIGSTYSVFTSSSVDDDVNIYKTGVLDVTYTLSEENISFTTDMIVPDDEVLAIKPYRITVSNVGNVPYKFDLKLIDTTATNVIDSKYIMTKVGELESKALVDCKDNIIKDGIIVPANDSAIIDIRIYLSEDIQNSEIGKSFYAKLSVDGVAVYSDNEEVNNSLLVAPNDVHIFFDANGGVTEVSDDVYFYGNIYENLPIPFRDGYVFDGWYTDEVDGVKIIEGNKVEFVGEKTLYARWIIDSDNIDVE